MLVQVDARKNSAGKTNDSSISKITNKMILYKSFIIHSSVANIHSLSYYVMNAKIRKAQRYGY